MDMHSDVDQVDSEEELRREEEERRLLMEQIKLKHDQEMPKADLTNEKEKVSNSTSLDIVNN
jgi:hypothetical protein